MITTQEFIFSIIAILYGIGGLFLLFYTDHLSKKLKKQEELERNRRANECRYREKQDDCKDRRNKHHEESPLLGVVWPPVSDRNDQ